jgi:hypothetical protein
VAAALTAPASEGRAYNLAGPSVPLSEVVRALRGGRRPLRLPVPVRIAYDYGAAERDLAFAPRDVAQALAAER